MTTIDQKANPARSIGWSKFLVIRRKAEIQYQEYKARSTGYSLARRRLDAADPAVQKYTQ